ncbi:MAG: hypothetical protein PHS37_04000 [Candidatus Omnitrophica bacterium]|nr:hypothetical protein [Candidatus Omnitrophota bacterium]
MAKVIHGPSPRIKKGGWFIGKAILTGYKPELVRKPDGEKTIVDKKRAKRDNKSK